VGNGKIVLLRQIFGLSILCACLAAQADDRLLVLLPPAFDPAARVAGSVGLECNVDRLVGDAVLQKLGQRFAAVEQIQREEKAGGDRFVRLTILNAHGLGGGQWTGPKGISLRVELLQNGKPVSSNVFLRNSRGGILGPVAGICMIMERIASQLGEDVTRWIAGQAVTTAGAADVAQSPAVARKSLLVQVPAVFGSGAPINAAARQSCGVEFMLGTHALQAVRRRVSGADPVRDLSEAGAGRVLKLTILDLQSHENGKWEMTARADLVEGARLLDSRTFSRDTNLFDVTKGGSCYLVERMAIQLGRDTAAWLSSAVDIGSGSQGAKASNEADAHEQPVELPR
jgi:hypothetical protein